MFVVGLINIAYQSTLLQMIGNGFEQNKSIRSTNPSSMAPAAMILSLSAMLVVAVSNGVMTSSHQQVGTLILSRYVMKK